MRGDNDTATWEQKLDSTALSSPDTADEENFNAQQEVECLYQALFALLQKEKALTLSTLNICSAEDLKLCIRKELAANPARFVAPALEEEVLQHLAFGAPPGQCSLPTRVLRAHAS